MLDVFRQKGLTSAVYGAVIVATVLVFVINFNPSAGKKLGSISDACAAKVRGNCIEPKAHRAAYRLVFSRGAPGMRQAQASRFVLEGMIERELLIGEAERLGLTVSEDEITDSIFKGDIYVSLPSENPNVGAQVGFPNGSTNVDRLVPNGYKNKDTKQFDMKIYERTIKQLVNRSPAEFREWQARELLAAKMRDLVKAPIRVAEDEAFDKFVEERSTSTVGYVIVRKGWVEKYAISTDAREVDEWAKANPAKIMVPVRHILVKGDKEKADELAAAKTKAEGILERVKKGEDFAKLAQEFSEDPGSKDKGGQYPGEQVENFVPEFKKSVEGLKPGELDQQLVQTSYGYHIIKRDPATKEDILKAYKGGKSDDLARTIAKDVAADMKSGKSADDAIAAAIVKYAKFTPKVERRPEAAGGDAGADAAAAPVEETFTPDKDPTRPQVLTSSAFNRGGDPIPAISHDATESIVKFAFEGKPGDVAPEPVKTDDGYIVVSLKEQKAASREDFDKERDTYAASLLAAKQNEALAYYVRRLRESSKQEIKVDTNNLFGAPKGDGGASRDDEDDE
ncbi:MAG: peptidylprolyl isomerase [Labilithrix sp.]|nr:peptidylprolyl isomerase [Labilithrix sp.]MCW5815651.1 peptidylprolyl isomerase [Labilithrix sp.]